MRATNGFRRYFRLPLLPTRGAYLDVSPSRMIFRYLLVDVSLLYSFFFSFFHSRSPSPPSLCFLPFVLSYSGGFSASRFVCTLPNRRNLLIASFLDGRRGCAASFLTEESKWTWSRNWFSCSAAGKGFSLRLPNHPIVCRASRDSWIIWTEYFVHQLGMLQFNRVPIILLIGQNQIVSLKIKEKSTRKFL